MTTRKVDPEVQNVNLLEQLDGSASSGASIELRRFNYATYRSSEAWGRKRSAVMDRSRGVCEGCGNMPAVEVHHLTYSHVGDEFLFELVALCRDCHCRLHNAYSPQPTAPKEPEREWSDNDLRELERRVRAKHGLPEAS